MPAGPPRMISVRQAVGLIGFEQVALLLGVTDQEGGVPRVRRALDPVGLLGLGAHGAP